MSPVSNEPLRRLPFDFAAHPLGIRVTRLETDDRSAAGKRIRSYATVVYIEADDVLTGERARASSGEAGTVLVVAPGEVHDEAETASANGWLMEFVPSAVALRAGPGDVRLPRPGEPLWLVLVRAACPVHRHVVPRRQRGTWEANFSRLAAELESPRLGYEEAVRALTTVVLVDLSRLVVCKASAVGRPNETVAAVFAYIEEHFHEPISLDDVAVAVARSPAAVARTVRRFTGRSVNAWIAERRQAEARRLLAESDDSVECIAEKAGFADPAYFRRRFKETHGRSPREWRRSVRTPASAALPAAAARATPVSAGSHSV